MPDRVDIPPIKPSKHNPPPGSPWGCAGIILFTLACIALTIIEGAGGFNAIFGN